MYVCMYVYIYIDIETYTLYREPGGGAFDPKPGKPNPEELNEALIKGKPGGDVMGYVLFADSTVCFLLALSLLYSRRLSCIFRDLPSGSGV